MNALRAGVGVDFSVSLNCSNTVVPDATTDDRVGGAISGPAVELLVTACEESEMASFPAVSCTAKFVAQLFGVGAVYETVTVLPASTAEPSVSCTTEEFTATLLTEYGTPLTETVKSDAEAVVAFSVSLYASDNTVPAVFNDAESSVGAVVSPGTVELFVTAVFVNARASLPTLSCTAIFDVALFEAGARYETVTVWLEVIVGEILSVKLLPGDEYPIPPNETGLPFTNIVNNEPVP